jgi:hypothetical protein
MSELAASRTVLFLIFLALAGIFIILLRIFSIMQRVFSPTVKQRLQMLDERTRFNVGLLDESNIAKLNQFADSEAALSAALDERAAEASSESTAHRIEDDYRDRPKGFVERLKKGWSENKGWIKEKLIDKINDLAKSAVGLGAGGE